MKDHSRALKSLMTSLLALSCAGFGMARWSSELSMEGKVTLTGSWDLAVESASILSTSTGVSVSGEALVEEPVFAATVYDVYAVFQSESQEYRLSVDDENPQTASLSQRDFEQYVSSWYIPGTPEDEHSFYLSGKTGCDTQFVMKTNELANVLGFQEGWISRSAQDDAYDGEIIAQAIVQTVLDPQGNVWNLQADYDSARTFFDAHPSSIRYPAHIEDNGTRAVFADVCLGLPGAWAQYEVTVFNRGSADAKLTDAWISLDTDSALLKLDTPQFADDEVLAPGESCTFTFVVSAADTTGALNESGSIEVKLSHEQQSVEAPPAPEHTHHS